MSAEYSLSINGAAPVASYLLDCTVLRRQRVNQGADTVTLRFARQAGDVLPLTHLDKVVIYADGVPFFTGWAITPKGGHAPTTSSVDVTLHNSWYWFTQYTFCRLYPGYEEAADGQGADINNGVTLHFGGDPAVIANVNDVLSSYTMLVYANVGFFEYQTLPEQLAEVLEYVRLQTLREFGEAAYQIGTIDLPALYGLFYEGPDQKCDVAVRKGLAAYPDGVLWWDYSTLPPTVHAGVMRNATALPLTLGQVDLTKSSLHARHDMRVTGVVLRYDGNYIGLTTWHSNRGTFAYPAGVQMNNHGVFTKSFLVDNSTSGEPTYNNALAQSLYESLNRLIMEGNLTFQAEGLRLDARPGAAWHLTGDDPLTEGGNLWTQSVTDDLATGTTSCELGFPKQLGLEDLQSLSDRIRLHINYNFGSA